MDRRIALLATAMTMLVAACLPKDAQGEAMLSLRVSATCVAAKSFTLSVELMNAGEADIEISPFEVPWRSGQGLRLWVYVEKGTELLSRRELGLPRVTPNAQRKETVRGRTALSWERRVALSDFEAGHLSIEGEDVSLVWELNSSLPVELGSKHNDSVRLTRCHYRDGKD